MQGKEQIMQMIEGIKGNLAELESALGEGESETPTEESPDMGGEEMGMGMAKEMPPEEGEKEEMPPMLKKFMRG